MQNCIRELAGGSALSFVILLLRDFPLFLIIGRLRINFRTMSDCHDLAFPPLLRQAEHAAIHERRPTLPGVTAPAQPANIVGLALSGGGIRSATFSLGILQALARERLLGKIDYLSTVSGGGYIGAFLGRFFTRQGPGAKEGRDRPTLSDTERAAAVEKVEAHLADPFSEENRWLRENGRYLSPTGSGDSFLGLVVHLRNWITVHLILGLLFLTLFLAVNLLRYQPFHINLDWLVPSWFAPVWFGGKIGEFLWCSPLLAVPALLFVLWAVPLAWAYWFTQAEHDEFRSWIPLIGVILLIVFTGFLGVEKPAWWSIAVLAALALLCWLGTLWAAPRNGGADEFSRTAYCRNRLTRGLARAACWIVATAAIGLIDTLGQSLYDLWARGGLGFEALTTAIGITSFAGVARWLAVFLGKITSSGGERISVPRGLLAGATAFLLALTLLTSWSALAHCITWQAKAPDFPQPDSWPTALGCGAALVLTLLLGQCLRFVNLSSQQQLYSARITRAYLGASNSNRHKPDNRNVSEMIPGDDLHTTEYLPHKSGGPLHLINVTLNETVSGLSQLEHRDRQGIPLAIGPCGLSAGVRSHALWDDQPVSERMTEITPIPLPERKNERGELEPGFHLLAAARPRKNPSVKSLDLGHWIAISGAAFTTGLGARTSLGFSLLLGLANVRLGYWWDSGLNPEERDPEDRDKQSRTKPAPTLLRTLSRVLPAQIHLLEEFLARFHGPARRHWYLSDGGHFENTAAYELIRRRVPLIVVCDNGQDAKGEFEDVANLVRKARLDYNAEIKFLSAKELAPIIPKDLRDVFGTLQELRPRDREKEKGTDDGDGCFTDRLSSHRHATLAWVFYEGEATPSSALLLIKPSLTGNEPTDVLQYHGAHPDFPQETTLDQFFDEAQWESYRALGDHIGRRVFSLGPAGSWRPADLTKPLFTPTEK